uniref:Myotubularin phosphatase domain-containing protein n=1 Tax=Arcella intermedia TaxID=1963864 RepID=A0A6B2L126_9EUKA
MHFYSKSKKDSTDLEETYNSISRVNKIPKGSLLYVEIEFKSLKIWAFSVPESMAMDLSNALSSYITLRDPVTKSITNNCRAFEFILPFDSKEDGWLVYNQRKDIERMFLPLEKDKLMWTICEANKDWKLCSSYPRLLVLPSKFDMNLLNEAANYRDEGRFPALSWIHPKNYATITRCSQPLPGRLGNKRCETDEALIKAIFQANPSVNLSENKILDARPFSNAIANRAKGAGYENSELYCNVSIEFLDIENIHQMRESLEKLRKLCYSCSPTETAWFSKLESTSWYSHVSAVLKGAIKLATFVDQGRSSVLHCSHGWDRTAQISAIAQLLLDPHYRTLVGFQQLIEKEWISFGHKSQDRGAHLIVLDSNPSPSLKEEESPIFLQFIDCVYQLIHQFPTEFGFTEDLLRTVIEHFYSCQFGTFLVNSEQEQHLLHLRQKTVSLWTYVNHPSNFNRFQNPFFRFAKHFGPNGSTFLHASSTLDQMVFWSELYNGPERIRSERKMAKIVQAMWEANDQIEKLKMENEALKREIKQVK